MSAAMTVLYAVQWLAVVWLTVGVVVAAFVFFAAAVRGGQLDDMRVLGRRVVRRTTLCTIGISAGVALASISWTLYVMTCTGAVAFLVTRWIRRLYARQAAKAEAPQWTEDSLP